VTPDTAARRGPLGRPATAWLLGGLLLALAIAAVPLSRLAATVQAALELVHVSVCLADDRDAAYPAAALRAR